MKAAEQELKVTFTASIVKKEVVKALDGRSDAGVFSVQEIDIGGEDFVVVFGRTHVEASR